MAELVPNSRATVIALEGELGAGKTTFVQALARALGVTKRVVSPTFILMRRLEVASHDAFDTLVHIDAYRIAAPGELDAVRFNDLLAERRSLICIEWASRIGDALPQDAYRITLSHMEGGQGRRAVYGYADDA